MEMEYLIRFVQTHESFRQPEIEALASLENIEVNIVNYRADVRRKSFRKLHFVPRIYIEELRQVTFFFDDY